MTLKLDELSIKNLHVTMAIVHNNMTDDTAFSLLNNVAIVTINRKK